MQEKYKKKTLKKNMHKIALEKKQIFYNHKNMC